jgi:hypothetical protein
VIVIGRRSRRMRSSSRWIASRFSSTRSTRFRCHRAISPSPWRPSSSRELREAPIHIVIRVPAKEAQAPEALQIKSALSAYFSKCAESLSRDLRELFRVGRVSLVIGLGVLALCSIGANAINEMFASPIARFASEGLIILGWVANWRPIEIFLYEWWPLLRLRRLHQGIAAASVEIVPRTTDPV